MELIKDAKDERLSLKCNDPQVDSPCQEELFHDSLRAALQKLHDLKGDGPWIAYDARIKAITEQRDAALAQLAEAERKLCAIREAWGRMQPMGIVPGTGRVAYTMDHCDQLERVFSDNPSPCRHEEEVKRLMEAVEWAMGDIAKDIARCSIPSGNKQYDALKGQLRKSLELFRNELRRRAGGGE